MLANAVISSYTGWDQEYKENRDQYDVIFAKAMGGDTGGIQKLEDTTAHITGRKYSVACASATDALLFSLQSNGIGPGDEVLVTNFSFISTSSCITMAGATPVFCDIDLDTYHVSVDSMERMISDKTKAVIYTHLFGNMCDMTAVIAFCKLHGLILIEDSAQSLGSSYGNTIAGSIGNCSVISFNTNKVVSGITGGGVMLTDNPSIAARGIQLRMHGGTPHNFEMVGRMSKMFPANADVINFRLQFLDRWQLKRQMVADRYNDGLSDLPIIIQKPSWELNHNYHKYVIRFCDNKTRNVVRSRLNATVHYERPLSENTMYDTINHRKDAYINSKLACNTILSLPIHPWMMDEEVDHIIQQIRDTLI